MRSCPAGPKGSEFAIGAVGEISQLSLITSYRVSTVVDSQVRREQNPGVSSGSYARCPCRNVVTVGRRSMKRIPVLLVLLLALPVFSRADTINLTSGFGQIYPYHEIPGFSFVLRGGRYSIVIPNALDDFGGSLVICFPCLNPAVDGPLFDASGILGGSGDNPIEGVIQFDAVSFVSSIGPGGVLTVKYRASAFIDLFRHPEAPNPTEFVWGQPNQLWYVTARFVPDSSGFPGLYDFAGASLSSTPKSPVPEPASLILVGTGVWPIVLALRKRRLLSLKRRLHL